jgi:hypothetical protein
MNRRTYQVLSAITALVLAFGISTRIEASPEFDAFYQRLAPGDTANWSFEESGSLETISGTSDGWWCQAGGDVAATHYARIKYKLPEQAGKVLTTFYMRAVIVLPSGFYSQQKAGFRLLNTDNFATTLYGEQVGASNFAELRTGVYIYSDHSLRIVASHEKVSGEEFYRSSTRLPVGEHIFELYGSVSEVAPWYFKVDGMIVGSGIARLSPDSVPVSERIVTRLSVGIDGASEQDDNPMRVLVKSFEIADYDRSASGSEPPKPTTTAIESTSIPATPTGIDGSQTTNTPVEPTSTFSALTPVGSTVPPTSIAPIQTLIQDLLTAIPVETLRPDPLSIPTLEALASALPDFGKVLSPQGTPSAIWKEIPIMQQATAGQEFYSSIYSFKAAATAGEAHDFYDTQLPGLGWGFLYSVPVEADETIMVFRKEGKPLTITILSAADGIVVILTLA